MKFVCLESRVAGLLGVSVATLRKGRKQVLVEGEHWGLIEHENRKRVAYSYAGVAVLVEKTAAYGSRAAEALEAADVALIQSGSDVRETGEDAGQDRPDAGGTLIDASKLLAGPWEVPDAVLVVDHLTKNRRIMMCRLPEAWIDEHGYAFYHRLGIDPREKMRVEVKTTENFIEGMEVKCCHVQQDLWKCTQRLPRWKGRY